MAHSISAFYKQKENHLTSHSACAKLIMMTKMFFTIKNGSVLLPSCIGKCVTLTAQHFLHLWTEICIMYSP